MQTQPQSAETELTSCDWDHMGHKISIIYILALYREFANTSYQGF